MPDDPSKPDWEALRRRAAALGVALDDAAMARLRLYARRLTEWNQRFNLTAIRDPGEILVKHFLDSLSLAAVSEVRAAGSLVDVGSGGGFPGLVVKIALPQTEVLLLDAAAKRLRFLERVIAELGLAGIRTHHARAEDAARHPDYRERYDVAAARAVGRLDTLVEWLLPFVRVGGVAVAMKGPDVADELREARAAIALLGGGEPRVESFALPESDVRRSLVIVPKTSPTPSRLPRRPGAARKRPLSLGDLAVPPDNQSG